jgi:hypothetical protein
MQIKVIEGACATLGLDTLERSSKKMWSLILIGGTFLGAVAGTVPGFQSEATCNAAGARMVMEFGGDYTCVSTGNVSIGPRSGSVVAPFGIPRICVNSLGQSYIAPNGPCRPGDAEID